jgi:hypothetical protein
MVMVIIVETGGSIGVHCAILLIGYIIYGQNSCLSFSLEDYICHLWVYCGLFAFSVINGQCREERCGLVRNGAGAASDGQNSRTAAALYPAGG